MCNSFSVSESAEIVNCREMERVKWNIEKRCGNKRKVQEGRLLWTRVNVSIRQQLLRPVKKGGLEQYIKSRLRGEKRKRKVSGKNKDKCDSMNSLE